MAEKKISQLPDEALDAVSGGAYYRKNESTGGWDVFTGDGTLYNSFSNESDAIMAASVLKAQEFVQEINSLGFRPKPSR